MAPFAYKRGFNRLGVFRSILANRGQIHVAGDRRAECIIKWTMAVTLCEPRPRRCGVASRRFGSRCKSDRPSRTNRISALGTFNRQSVGRKWRGGGGGGTQSHRGMFNQTGCVQCPERLSISLLRTIHRITMKMDVDRFGLFEFWLYRSKLKLYNIIHCHCNEIK